MVGGVPVGLALRDLFYAAGLGFLLCVGYSAARMLLGSGKAVCFICDAAVLAVGALLYRSAAMSRFYAGQPRWYTLAGCVLCFLASRAALEPLLSGVEAFVRWCLAWPFVMLWRAVLRPFAGAVSARFQRVRTAHSAGRVKKSRAAERKGCKTAAACCIIQSDTGGKCTLLWMEHPRAAVLQNAPAGEEKGLWQRESANRKKAFRPLRYA